MIITKKSSRQQYYVYETMFIFQWVEEAEDHPQDQVNIGTEKARSMGIGKFWYLAEKHYSSEREENF